MDKPQRPTKEQLEILDRILSKIPDNETIQENANIIKALSDPTRLKIVYILQYGERCACEITAALGKPQSTTSHHLNILKNAGILKWKKAGIWIHYSLKDENIPKIIDKLVNKINR